ncbi:hypothetical protein, partial [Streptomyces sp. NPDC004675]|uniref:hypothetical protein n=1 Tax=Streptomyces sp. NPDC004675 TaxID=3154286 RepID=UPI0033A7478C
MIEFMRAAPTQKSTKLVEFQVRQRTVMLRGLRGLAFSGQTSDRSFHAPIRNFSYSAWTSRGG